MSQRRHHLDLQVPENGKLIDVRGTLFGSPPLVPSCWSDRCYACWARLFRCYDAVVHCVGHPTPSRTAPKRALHSRSDVQKPLPLSLAALYVFSGPFPGLTWSRLHLKSVSGHTACSSREWGPNKHQGIQPGSEVK